MSTVVASVLAERRRQGFLRAWDDIRKKFEKLMAVVNYWIEQVLVPAIRRVSAYLDAVGYTKWWLDQRRARIRRMHSAYHRRQR